MNKNERKYILLIVFFIFGVALSLQIRSTLNTKKLAASNTLSVERVANQLAEEQKAVNELKREIDDNLSKRDELIKEYASRNMGYDTVSELNTAKFKAGFVEVKGPGITIKLDDAKAREKDIPLKYLLIHDQDIKVLVNELKKAGAQAIAINGERVTAISEQVCAGPTILINGNRYAVPYIIDAIGNPDILYDNIIKCPKMAELTEFKIQVEVNKSKEIKIAKFSGIMKIDRFISELEEVKK